jgi:tRNA(adenine34) deaminase
MCSFPSWVGEQSLPKVSNPALTQQDEMWMSHALTMAKLAANEDEVPVGAIVVYQDKIIGRGYNKKETLFHVTAHAEIEAMQQASQSLKSWRLHGCTLYVTLEPCLMCTGALVHSRIDRLVYAVSDPKSGAIVSTVQLQKIPRIQHLPLTTSGVLENEAKHLLSSYFKRKRHGS